MDKKLLNDFNAFRTWFNARFSLSLNGKFVGLCRLRNWQMFAYRLYKYLNGYFRRPLGNIITFHLGKDSFKLYSR